jgi:hypothetical protein
MITSYFNILTFIWYKRLITNKEAYMNFNPALRKNTIEWYISYKTLVDVPFPAIEKLNDVVGGGLLPKEMSSGLPRLLLTKAKIIDLDMSSSLIRVVIMLCKTPKDVVIFASVLKAYSLLEKEHFLTMRSLIKVGDGKFPSPEVLSTLWDLQKVEDTNFLDKAFC